MLIEGAPPDDDDDDDDDVYPVHGALVCRTNENEKLMKYNTKRN